MRFVKNSDSIEYPISEWDISQFCLPNAKGSKYRLNGVILHYEIMGGGHYTAIGYNFIKKRWVTFNDTKIHFVKGQREIMSQNAYVLFYQRIND